MTDLFTGPAAPELAMRPTSSRACVYDGLKTLALQRWAWKRDVETFGDNLLRGRTSGERQQELESPGRNIRHVRTALDGTGWTVLDEAGHVCLCLKTDEAAMLNELRASMPTRKGGDDGR